MVGTLSDYVIKSIETPNDHRNLSQWSSFRDTSAWPLLQDLTSAEIQTRPEGFQPYYNESTQVIFITLLEREAESILQFFTALFYKKVSEKEHVLSHKFQGWSGRERSAPGSEHSKPANPQKWPFIQEFRSLRDVFLVWVWSLGPRWRGYLSRYPTKRWASVSEGADISLVQIQLLDYYPFRPQTDSMTLSFENGGF